MEEQLLESCGLNKTERSILLFLLKRGKSTAGLISKRTNIKRTTVYSALANLETMGLVGRNSEGNATLFTAIEADTIPNIFINRAKHQLEKVTQASLLLETCLKQFDTSHNHKIAGYEISTFESEDAVFNYIEGVLVKGNYRGIFNPQTAFIDRGKDVALKCLEATAVTQPPIKEIAIKGKLCKWWKARIDNPNHIVKEISGNQNLVTDILLFDQKILLTNYSKSCTMGILIKHDDYYEFMTAIFDTFWEMIN